jgi:hypothetical protein
MAIRRMLADNVVQEFDKLTILLEMLGFQSLLAPSTLPILLLVVIRSQKQSRAETTLGNIGVSHRFLLRRFGSFRKRSFQV